MTQNGTCREPVSSCRITTGRSIPAIRRELVDHAAADGFPLSGMLYLPARGEPDVVVLAMHPRVDFSRHYLAPGLVARRLRLLRRRTRAT